MPTLDALVLDLRRLRIVRGGASYAELATRIQALREVRGLAPAAARVARSSVFDAFQLGRVRLNAELVADIVRALDGASSGSRCSSCGASSAPARSSC